MKVRVKFRKYGVMKFVGHLDIMRFFQKLIRRAELPAAFTEGFSPHMVMSFAHPLGVGLTSDGEYFDMELTREINLKDAALRMNRESVEGIEIVSITNISDEKKRTGMAITAAADYRSVINAPAPPDLSEKCSAFLRQEHICITKKTKRSEAETDIRPMIYRFEADGDGIYMRLAAGSARNLKPELVMQAFADFLGLFPEEVSFTHHRLDLYADEGDGNFVSLDKVY